MLTLIWTVCNGSLTPGSVRNVLLVVRSPATPTAAHLSAAAKADPDVATPCHHAASLQRWLDLSA
jgi:hypothetical protein